MLHLKMLSWKLCIIVLLFEYCSCQNACEQPNVAGIVVGSVFGTLAVVALILGVVAFLLWRRNKVFKSGPKKTRKVNSSGLSEDRASPEHDGHVNPAFNDNQPDISAAEAGFGGYVQCGEYAPNTDRNKSPVSKDDKRKTWTSLPHQDLPELLQRHGSCGSLDDNYLNSMDPEVISVWLQSQDFIGLGFNISGNMRDGIFVSHVHNRGPAIESGKVKVGDHIKSVTISFESMVYEDALTILSYASPYPVKVSLMKEKVMVNDRRLSDSNENLSHPLYRSQSLDALQRIGKEPLFKPKRTLSEMKPETRKDSARAKKLQELQNEALIEGALGQSPDSKPKQERVVDFTTSPIGQMNTTLSDVTVHTEDEGQQRSGLDFPDIGIPNFDFVQEKEEPVFVEQSAKTESSVQRSVGERNINSSAALEFASLMDQMLDLKDSEADGTEVAGKMPGVSAEVTSAVNTTPKTPTKPQRRKRPSSSTSPNSTLSSESLIQPEFAFDVKSPVKMENVALEDIIVPSAVKSVASAPTAWDDREEVTEEEIVPETAKREIHIGSDNIQFSPKDIEVSSPQRPPSPLDDLETFSLSMRTARAKPPEGDPVVEDFIEAVVAKRDSSAPPPRIIYDEIVAAESSANFSAPNLDVSVEKKKKDNQKKPPELDEEMLEQIISMNAQPPGTSALNWRNDNDIQTFEIPEKDRPTSPKGIAYEIRDDIMTGLPRAVDLNKSNIARTMSYDLKLSDKRDDKGSMLRDDQNSTSSERIESLDWSGKRLVRSGSFTDIPQNASASDWTEQNLSSEGYIRIKSDVLDSDSDSDKVIKKTTDTFTPRENLTNLSHMSDALSPLTIRSASSPETANGQSLQFTSTERTVSKNNNIDGLPSLEKTYGSSISSDKKGSYSIKLSMEGNEDEDVEC
ncbi:periaxin-like [Haliotis asinina]|uniref:periaxin-like n=1 Tax=Haliotis asinina TaxID=109174 RepID=UPI003532444E